MSHRLTPIQKQRSHLAANGQPTRLRPRACWAWELGCCWELRARHATERDHHPRTGGSLPTNAHSPGIFLFIIANFATHPLASAVGAPGKAVDDSQGPEWAPVRCRSAPALVWLNSHKRQASCQHASGSGTIPLPHVAKARLGDLGPGRGGIRPLALTQKPLSHSAGSRASNHAGQIFSGAPCPLPGTPCRYVSGPLTVPGEK